MSLEILKFSAVHQFSPKAKNFNIRQTFQKVSVKNPKNFYNFKILNFFFSGMTIDAVNEKFHHSDHCWVVDEQDVLMLMANL